MDYKVELVTQNQLINEGIYKDLSHPHQAIRKILKSQNNDFLTVYVMNLEGEVWVYGFERKKDNTYKNYPIVHDYKSRAEVVRVFSGSLNIHQIV